MCSDWKKFQIGRCGLATMHVIDSIYFESGKWAVEYGVRSDNETMSIKLPQLVRTFASLLRPTSLYCYLEIWSSVKCTRLWAMVRDWSLFLGNI